MKITPAALTVGEVLKDFVDDGEGGVRAFSGKLDIRPAYQREFVYKDKERNAVIATVLKEHPLNVLYFAVRDDGTFEVMDGQQRLISLGQYLAGDFSFEQRSFGNLPLDLQEKILDYKLSIYLCEGLPSEKLEWFEIINIAGVTLTKQELRNAVYHGPFLSDAKRWFSKSGCPAAVEGEGYVSGKPIRQELLELAMKWAIKKTGDPDVDSYMDKNRNQPNASELWAGYLAIITWAKTCFPKVRKPIMASVDWGGLHSIHGHKLLDSDELERRVSKLILDDDVQNKSGIYSFVFDNDPRHLNLRAFSEQQKLQAYEKQEGHCAAPSYSGHPKETFFELGEMEADHIVPWSLGGATSKENCQMLCKACNRRKSNK